MKHFKIGNHEICTLCIIIFAVALRIILIGQGWPQTDSDEGTLGLMALHIAYRGEYPLFFYGQGYMGPLEAYLGALLFHLFGPSLFVLRLGLIIIFALFLVSTYLLSSLLYSKNLALVTLSLLSLGSVGMLYTQLRALGGYVEMLLFGSLLLLLASWLALSYNPDLSLRRRLLRYLVYACWGYVMGVAIWTDVLIIPFALMSALLLLLCCWPELDSWAPACIIACFTLGVLPSLIYNITTPPQQGSLFYLLLDYRSDITGQTFKHIPFIQKMLGAVLVGLPQATGANPLCSHQSLSASRLFSFPNLGCTLRQGCWAIGCITLWLAAVILNVRAFWQRRRHVQASAEYSAERQATVRCIARLMLLGAAGLTFLLFAFSPVAALIAFSPVAALNPGAYFRYLICLLIVTPAIIAPLWNDENTAANLLTSRWPIKVLAVIKRAILLYIGLALLLGSIGIFTIVPAVQAINQQQDSLISNLLRLGATHIISEYWTCDRLIFQSDERIICSVVDEHLRTGYNRYTPYYLIVKEDPHATFVFPLGSPEAVNMAHRAARFSKHFRRLILDGYVVYQPI